MVNDLRTKRIVLTQHAFKRHRQRVGGNTHYGRLQQRCQTALMCGLYQHGAGLIKLHGSWWGCTVTADAVILTTCYGRKDRNMIRQRRAHGQ